MEIRQRRHFELTDQSDQLGLNQRSLQRRHADTMVENEVAREIIDLRRSVKKYVSDLRGKRNEVDKAVLAAQGSMAERLDNLKSEWVQQQEKYRQETEALEAQLAKLDDDFEE